MTAKIKKRILVAPLDWGLGHATRVIPIIRHLLNSGQDVVLAASGRAKVLLEREFSDLPMIDFPDYRVRYYRYTGVVIGILLQLPKIILGIIRENSNLRKLVRENNIDIVISDNRYGLYHRGCRTVFMTHQLAIRVPAVFDTFAFLPWFLLSAWLRKFDQVWLPDVPGVPNLSGALTRRFPLPPNARFIGLLTPESDRHNVKETDVFIMISGPEPSRTRFEALIRAQLPALAAFNVVVLLGKPEADASAERIAPNVVIYPHLSRNDIAAYMAGAKIIVARSGYTTVMEAQALRKKCYWIPTPGQLEQEYLASYLAETGYNLWAHQRDFNLAEAVKALYKVQPAATDSIPANNAFLLKDSIQKLLE